MKSKRMIFVSKIKIMLMFLLMIFILASCNKNKELQVKFIDWDGVELKTEIVSPGKSATAPIKPDRKEGHHFSSWDKDFTNVTSDLVVTAIYEINRYTVTWKNYDGTILKVDDNIKWGSEAFYDGKTPSRSTIGEVSYIFSGWSPKLALVVEDVEYTAQFTPKINEYYLRVHKLSIPFYNNNISIINITTGAKIVLDKADSFIDFSSFSFGDVIKVSYEYKDGDEINPVSRIRAIENQENNYLGLIDKIYFNYNKVDGGTLVDGKSYSYEFTVDKALFNQNVLEVRFDTTTLKEVKVFYDSINDKYSHANHKVIVGMGDDAVVYETSFGVAVPVSQAITIIPSRQIFKENVQDFVFANNIDYNYTSSFVVQLNYDEFLVDFRSSYGADSAIIMFSTIPLSLNVSGALTVNGERYSNYIATINGSSISVNNYSKTIKLTDNQLVLYYTNTELIKKHFNFGNTLKQSYATYVLDKTTLNTDIFSIVGGYYFNGVEVVKDADGHFEDGNEYPIIEVNIFELAKNYPDNGYDINFIEVYNNQLPLSQLMGDGTKNNPYQINTLQDLNTLSLAFSGNGISQYINGKYFKLTKSFELESRLYGNSSVRYILNPIGTENLPFDGYFDGGRIDINNLTIVNSSQNAVGLFGWVGQGAVVENVVLLNPTIINNKAASERVGVSGGVDYEKLFIGTIAGHNSGIVRNSAVVAYFSIGNTKHIDFENFIITSYNANNNNKAFVGGIVGANAGQLHNVSFQGAIENDYYTGGAVGINIEGEISNLTINARLRATHQGGVVGRIGVSNQNAINNKISNVFVEIVSNYSDNNFNVLTKSYIGEFFVNPTLNINDIVTGFAAAQFANTNLYSNNPNANAGVVGDLGYNYIYQGEYNLDKSYNKEFFRSAGGQFGLYSFETNTFDALKQINVGYPLVANISTAKTIKNTAYINDELIEDVSIALKDQWNLHNQNFDAFIVEGLPFVISIEKVYNVVPLFIDKIEVVYDSKAEVEFENINKSFVNFINHENDIKEIKVYFKSIEVNISSVNELSGFTGTEIKQGLYSEVQSGFYIQNNYVKLISEIIVLTDNGYVNLYSLNQRVLNSQTDFTYNNREFKIQLLTYENNNLDINTPVYAFKILITSYGCDVRVFVTFASKYNIALQNAQSGNGVEVNLYANNNLLPYNLVANNQGNNVLYIPLHVLDEYGNFVEVVADAKALSTDLSQVDEIYELNNNVNDKIYDWTTRSHNTIANSHVEFDLDDYFSLKYNFENTVVFNQARVLYDVYYDTTMLIYNNWAQVNLDISNNAIDQNSQIEEFVWNAESHYIDIMFEANTVPTIEIMGVEKVNGYNNLYRYINTNKYVRFVWVAIDKVSLELSIINDSSAKQGNKFTFDTLVNSNKALMIYAISVVDITPDTAVHETSWHTSLSTDVDHRPKALVDEVKTNKVNGVKIPFAVADYNFVDYGTTVKYSSSMSHLTNELDFNRYEFHSLYQNKDICSKNDEQFVIDSIKDYNQVITYYTIKLVNIGLRNDSIGYNVAEYEKNIGTLHIKVLNYETNEVHPYMTKTGQIIEDSVAGSYSVADYEEISNGNSYIRKNVFYTYNGSEYKKVIGVLRNRSIYNNNSAHNFKHFTVPYGEKVVISMLDNDFVLGSMSDRGHSISGLINNYIDDMSMTPWSSSYNFETIEDPVNNNLSLSNEVLNINGLITNTDNQGYILNSLGLRGGYAFIATESVINSVLYNSTKSINTIYGDTNGANDRFPLDINDKLKIEIFRTGINSENITITSLEEFNRSALGIHIPTDDKLVLTYEIDDIDQFSRWDIQDYSYPTGDMHYPSIRKIELKSNEEKSAFKTYFTNKIVDGIEKTFVVLEIINDNNDSSVNTSGFGLYRLVLHVNY